MLYEALAQEVPAEFTLTTDAWRPQLTVTEVLTAEVPTDRYKVGLPRLANDEWGISSNSWILTQLGRALAQMDYWAVVNYNGKAYRLQHMETERSIEVSVTNGLATVREMHTNSRTGETFWKKHPITKGLGHFQDHGNPHIFWVYGDTYTYKEELKLDGGEWSSARKMWKFVGEVPQWVRDYPIMWSKYHLMTKMLLGYTPTTSHDDADYIIRDGYVRELWRVAGFDYKEFPRDAHLDHHDALFA